MHITKYKILKDITLSFFTFRSHSQYVVGPTDQCHLECGNNAIWVNNNSLKVKTTNKIDSIETWLEEEKIEKM